MTVQQRHRRFIVPEAHYYYDGGIFPNSLYSFSFHHSSPSKNVNKRGAITVSKNTQCFSTKSSDEQRISDCGLVQKHNSFRNEL